MIKSGFVRNNNKKNRKILQLQSKYLPFFIGWMVANFVIHFRASWVGPRIQGLHPLLRGKNPTTYWGCHELIMKPHLVVMLQFFKSEVCRVRPSFPLLPFPLWLRLVVPIHESNKTVWKLLILDWNAWNYIDICKFFVSRIVTWFGVGFFN